MSMRSYSTLYRLAEAGQTAALLEHLYELERDGDHDAKNWALVAAAEKNQPQTVVALLNYGANIEGAAESERPHIHPLWKAAKRGHLEVVQLLVSRGAQTAAVDSDGMTALDYAKRYGRATVVAYLESLNGKSA